MQDSGPHDKIPTYRIRAKYYGYVSDAWSETTMYLGYMANTWFAIAI